MSGLFVCPDLQSIKAKVINSINIKVKIYNKCIYVNDIYVTNRIINLFLAFKSGRVGDMR